MSCPISGPAGAGQGGCCGGPEGTLPPAGEFRTGVVCLSGPHLPPPGKVTSSHLPWTLYCPTDVPSHEEGGCWGAQLICTV